MGRRGAGLNWEGATSASYVLEQSFRYEYPEPIRDLSHRLVVIPPERFGDQVRKTHELAVDESEASVTNLVDRFGNHVVEVHAQQVSASIEFAVRVEVERTAHQLHRVPDGWLANAYLLGETHLTAADDRLLEVARDLQARHAWGVDLADAINDWVYGALTYQHGVTGVRTTAIEALAAGHGVCQDYAHVMIAICRACGLPTRYVSGHLVGEGGTHAWVEVLIPTRDGTGDAIAWAFDPTHAGRGGLNYVTVAVGADYMDVAPTSGTYVARVAGRLKATKRVTVTSIHD